MTASDWELIERYAREQSEEAFAELVSRHVDLVYSAALRQVRSPQLAEEVAQSVFIDLSRNAARLKPDTVLSPWLYQVTRRTAIDVVRRESRRQVREQIALEIADMNSNSPVWSQIEPLLDEAMETLEAEDRAALLLRYFENKSLREVGQALGASEDAAQKRVSRAVERLREAFTKRGISAGVAGIAALLSANAVQSAPLGLSSAISAASALAGAAVPNATLGLTKAIAMTTTQKTLILTVLALGAGAGIYGARQVSRLHEQVDALQNQQAPLTAQIEQLRHERDDSKMKLDALLQENEQLRQASQDVPKLRGEVARLRADARELSASKTGTNSATETEMRSWLARVDQLKQRLALTPESQIPELKLLNDQDWLNAAKGKLESDEDYRRALSGLRGAAESKFASDLRPALSKYIKASGGQFPTDLSQVQPYFKSPVDDAILQRWEIAPADKIPNVRVGGDWIITQKAAVDEEYDGAFVIGPSGYGTTNFKTVASDRDMESVKNVLDPAYQAYLSANGGKDPSDPSLLAPYLTTPEQQAALKRFQEIMAAQKHDE